MQSTLTLISDIDTIKGGKITLNLSGECDNLVAVNHIRNILSTLSSWIEQSIALPPLGDKEPLHDYNNITPEKDTLQ